MDLIKKIKKDPLAVKRINLEGWDEIPTEIKQCKSLEKLDIGYTDIEEIPEFVSQLPKLKTLHFYGCTHLKFPTNLSAYPSLKELGVFCKTQDELEAVFSLEHIEKLIITGRFSSISEQIAKMKNLTTLELFALPLTTLPKALNQLPKLSRLEMSTGLAKLDLEQVIDVLEGNKKLVELKLYTQNLKLPDSISRLKTLKKLNLEGNGLTEIPKALFDLTNLTELNLGINNLHSLPKGIGKLKKLKVLKLNSNWTNSIDVTNLMDEIHLLENLQSLHLWSCQSVKTLPESIVACKKLKELYLDNNLLEDLPDSIYEMTWLKKLQLTTNTIKLETKEKLINTLTETKIAID